MTKFEWKKPVARELRLNMTQGLIPGLDDPPGGDDKLPYLGS